MSGLDYFFDTRMLAYNFGPGHPFKPQRLIEAHEVLTICAPDLVVKESGAGRIEDYRAVHSEEYLAFTELISQSPIGSDSMLLAYGFTRHDTPAFAGVYEAAMAFGAGSLAAAHSVVNGCQVGVSMSGGLHHAKRSKAGGFCVLNDVAAACEVMRLQFGRVLYVDIDLHHGDGVEEIFESSEDVATLSIHESGRTLYPGTGFVDDIGPGGTAYNLPLEPYSSGEVWEWTFARGLEMVVQSFQPKAIVLQMGCDAHATDPLGHLNCRVQDWLAAVRLVRDLGLPMVAAGGGGYDLANVVRTWPAAVLTLAGREVPEYLPEPFATHYGKRYFLDDMRWAEPEQGRDAAEDMISKFERRVLSF